MNYLQKHYICAALWKLFRGDLKVPLFFDMIFSKNVLSLLSDSLENYPDVFLVDFKVSTDNAIKITLNSDKDINLKDCIDWSYKWNIHANF